MESLYPETSSDALAVVQIVFDYCQQEGLPVPVARSAWGNGQLYAVLEWSDFQLSCIIAPNGSSRIEKFGVPGEPLPAWDFGFEDTGDLVAQLAILLTT